ncbi:hypothetical protein [Isobaculum melis]|uniref:Uncharacterized protein n=1 Tax=Isobaculum melis TaxID=142588 RepID=A0A1H9SVK3_9LACT|nr:hypothetical protein [Isobaculum melis]SER89032.1 hypothetical protein SAMN04488559_10981 [Isobaculum melis]
MRKSTKVGVITISACIFLFLGGAFTYRYMRTQGIAESQTINKEEKSDTKVLILTQQSSFKDAVMEEVEKQFKGKDILIQIQDISTISQVKQSEWDGILLVTTVQSNDLPEKAVRFIKEEADFDKVQLFVTADSGNWTKQPADVDAVTTTSKSSNVDAFSKKINHAIQQIELDKLSCFLGF